MLKRIEAKMKKSPLFAFNEVGRDRWVALQAATLPNGASILDVGSCLYRSLFSHCDYRTQDFCQLKSEQSRLGGYGAIDYVCDITRIPAPEDSFDAVLCTEVLEHLHDPVSAIKEIARILKPGGKLFLTAPLGSGIHQEPFHFYGGFTPFWYKKFLSEAGFSDISIESNRGFFKYFSQEAIRFLKLSSPGRLALPIWGRLLWAPAWCLLLPFLSLAVPTLCHILDPYDRERAFTVGYFVTARKDKIH